MNRNELNQTHMLLFNVSYPGLSLPKAILVDLCGWTNLADSGSFIMEVFSLGCPGGMDRVRANWKKK